MIACYDLAKCPPTYDVVSFLAHAEIERKRRNETWMQIHILPGPVGGFRGDFLWPQSIEARKLLLQNIVVPMCSMVPQASVVVVDEHRLPSMGSTFGFNQYLISLSMILEALKQDCRPLRYISHQIIKDPKLVTITLREAEHHPQRNSNVSEWMEAARQIVARGYEVVIVPDTNQSTLAGLSSMVYSDAAIDLQKRAKLYSSAALNMGVNNGPMWMAIFMDVPVLMIKPTTEISGCYDRSYYAGLGLPEGSQLPTSPSYQRIVWQEDTADEIIKAFDAMGMP